RDVGALAVCGGPKAKTLDLDLVPAEKQAARRHLVDDRIQEIGQEQLGVRGLAAKLDALGGLDARGVGDDRRQRERRLLERLGLRRADAAHADIRIVRKMLVATFAHDSSMIAPTPRAFACGACRVGPNPAVRRGAAARLFVRRLAWHDASLSARRPLARMREARLSARPRSPMRCTAGRTATLPARQHPA